MLLPEKVAPSMEKVCVYCHDLVPLVPKLRATSQQSSHQKKFLQLVSGTRLSLYMEPLRAWIPSQKASIYEVGLANKAITPASPCKVHVLSIKLSRDGSYMSEVALFMAVYRLRISSKISVMYIKKTCQ